MIEISDLTRTAYGHEYFAIPDFCETKDVKRFIAETRRRFTNVAKGFDDERHTQWLVRNYLALKLILGATILTTSAEHAEEQNLQITLPYLNYYALLSCARALVLTLPDQPWKGLTSVQTTHQATINTAANALRRLDGNAETRWGDVLRKAQDHRELFSYRFPGRGLWLVEGSRISVNEARDIARLMAEVAQANSECLEAAVRKHAPGPHKLIENDDTWLAMTYETRHEIFIDDEDRWRIGSYFRTLDEPAPLNILATEGLVEDYFGAWASENEGGYNPDREWNVLLDIK